MRVWEVTPQGQYMKVALKEHKGAVSCIKIRTNNEEVSVCVCVYMRRRESPCGSEYTVTGAAALLQCVTASTDGTCIIWDLK